MPGEIVGHMHPYTGTRGEDQLETRLPFLHRNNNLSVRLNDRRAVIPKIVISEDMCEPFDFGFTKEVLGEFPRLFLRHLRVIIEAREPTNPVIGKVVAADRVEAFGVLQDTDVLPE